jgi:hypothetical protein
MKGLLPPLMAFLFLISSANVFAGRNEFCAGFTEGYINTAGKVIIIPKCPKTPASEDARTSENVSTNDNGSTDFREGVKAGIRAALTR